MDNEISQNEIDDIIYILIEYDSTIPRIYNNVMSHKEIFNLKSFLHDIDIYIKKYGKKELLYFLFDKGIIHLISSKKLKEKKHFTKIMMNKSHFDVTLCKEVFNDLENIVKNNDDGIIYFAQDILKEVENVKYRKTKNLYELQLELKSKNEELENKIMNFNKEILSIVSIILAIVPIIAINANVVGNKSYEVILGINGTLILAITTVYFLISITILENKYQKLFLFLIPLGISVMLIRISFL